MLHWDHDWRVNILESLSVSLKTSGAFVMLNVMWRLGEDSDETEMKIFGFI
jgi:hypothetical protein